MCVVLSSRIVSIREGSLCGIPCSGCGWLMHVAHVQVLWECAVVVGAHGRRVDIAANELVAHPAPLAV
jgi:hypothetical protein